MLFTLWFWLGLIGVSLFSCYVSFVIIIVMFKNKFIIGDSKDIAQLTIASCLLIYVATGSVVAAKEVTREKCDKMTAPITVVFWPLVIPIDIYRISCKLLEEPKAEETIRFEIKDER